MIQAEQFGTRAGLDPIAIFLLIGLLILLSVNEKRARQGCRGIHSPDRLK